MCFVYVTGPGYHVEQLDDAVLSIPGIHGLSYHEAVFSPGGVIQPRLNQAMFSTSSTEAYATLCAMAQARGCAVRVELSRE